MVNLDELFSKRLPEYLAGFVVREQQIRLSKKIQNIITAGGRCIYEAGTGTGKTLAYLTPIFASDATAIISTGTKNLQDQLYLKDIPVLQQLYPQKRVALLKGRSNYVCPYHLKQNIKLHQNNRTVMHELTQIRIWHGQTRTGDITEVIDADEHRALLPMVTSTTDNCLGNRCPDFDECPFYRARERASTADVVIVNHHLLFADLSLRDEHSSSLLPEVDVIVIDEAHQVHDVARQFFGQRLSSGMLADLIRELRAELFLLGNDDSETLNSISRLEKSFQLLRQKIGDSEEVSFSDWLNDDNETVVHRIDDALLELGDRLTLVGDRSAGLAQCGRRLFDLADNFAILTERSTGEEEYVHWIERHQIGRAASVRLTTPPEKQKYEGASREGIDNGSRVLDEHGRFTIHLTPMSIAAEFKSVMESSASAWVLTSATLAVQGSFELLQAELGLEDAETEVFPSPFDYPSLVRGIVIANLPLPGTEEHTLSLVDKVKPLIESHDGRTFFLFTSFRALRLAAQALTLAGRPLLVQGTESKSKLLASFVSQERSVLLATQSFWEGVDVRGADLKLVIIDKLPFPNPFDPMFRAESRKLEQSGRDSFSHISLPRTVLSLKQGFGRLVRQEDDKGVFVLGDSRVLERSYGRYVLQGLPEFPWLTDIGEVEAWLQD